MKMRIISQDGEFDLPYEETTLQAFYSGKVIAFPLSDLASDDFIPMATYSSKEKSIKAMEMCMILIFPIHLLVFLKMVL